MRMEALSRTFALVGALICTALCLPKAECQVVSRSISDINSFSWKQEWSTATGSFRSVSELPQGDNIDKNSTMAISVKFDKGFSYYNIAPVDSNIPGTLKSISLWGRRDGQIPCIISFKVKDPEQGKKYEWSPKLDAQWAQHRYDIPPSWPPVVGIGITSHNWSNQDKPHEGMILLNNLQVHTDMSGVPNRDELVTISARTGLPRNIFLHNEEIKYTVNIGSWVGKTLKGTLDTVIRVNEGPEVFRKTDNITLDSSLSKKLSYKPEKYGIYVVDIAVKLEGRPEFRQTSRCAWIPEIAPVTEQEKRMSPWGLNIHGGIEGVAYNSIAKLGFTWIRDYAYTYSWLIRGYGKGDWSGWPWYLNMDRRIKESGLKVLPCMSKGIQDYILKNPEPPNEWKDIIVKLMMQFPDYDAFEPDNELDLHIPKELEADNYQAYGRYHKRFAEIIKFMKPDAWAVTQGTAGFQTHVVRQMVKEGFFKDIDVINGHFYTGIYPALLSQTNENTGQGGEVPMHFFDRVREFVEAADSDGKKRQKWITEFGWDTLAVKIVTEKEQAAYAQRGYTLGLIGGLDKMFWYWNLDTKNTPSVFFDGMGIFCPREEPKPVAAAIASMIHFLKLPRPVGSFEMGDNSFGHVFEDRGRLVALAFKIDKDMPGPEVEFKSGKLFDMYANPLPGRKHKLDIAPIWIDGIAKDDPLVRATAYNLKSRWLVLGAAGDDVNISVEVNNSRNEQIDAVVKTTVPEGWTIIRPLQEIKVAPGSAKTFDLTVRIDPRTQMNSGLVNLLVSEKNGVSKNMPTQVQIVAPATMGTVALKGQPGTCNLVFNVRNNSLSTRSYTVKPSLPPSWKADPLSLSFDNMASGETRKASFDITWNSKYSAQDKAEMNIMDSEGNKVSSAGLIPNAISLPKAGPIKFDANFSDWPSGARLPDWAIGKTGNPENVELYAAYSDEGLLFGVKLEPSSAAGSNPKIFWSMDCLEVCIDTINDKTQRDKYSKTDHQFWIVPQVDQNKVYLGRWKRAEEIKEIMYDIQGVKGHSAKTPNGYAMEFMIPSSALEGFNPAKGGKIGLSLNLSSPGRTANILCYWPLPKTEGSIEKPFLWATAELE